LALNRWSNRIALSTTYWRQAAMRLQRPPGLVRPLLWPGALVLLLAALATVIPGHRSEAGGGAILTVSWDVGAERATRSFAEMTSASACRQIERQAAAKRDGVTISCLVAPADTSR
jgi:hypothetical protein